MPVHIKILIVLSMLFTFAGIYNFSWKSRTVNDWRGLPRTEQYRKPRVGWICLGIALICGSIAFILR